MPGAPRASWRYVFSVNFIVFHCETTGKPYNFDLRTPDFGFGVGANAALGRRKPVMFEPGWAPPALSSSSLERVKFEPGTCQV